MIANASMGPAVFAGTGAGARATAHAHAPRLRCGAAGLAWASSGAQAPGPIPWLERASAWLQWRQSRRPPGRVARTPPASEIRRLLFWCCAAKQLPRGSMPNLHQAGAYHARIKLPDGHLHARRRCRVHPRAPNTRVARLNCKVHIKQIQKRRASPTGSVGSRGLVDLRPNPSLSSQTSLMSPTDKSIVTRLQLLRAGRPFSNPRRDNDGMVVPQVKLRISLRG